MAVLVINDTASKSKARPGNSAEACSQPYAKTIWQSSGVGETLRINWSVIPKQICHTGRYGKFPPGDMT